METAIVQIEEGFFESEETKSEIIFGSIRRSLLNGVTLGILGFVKRDRYGGVLARSILGFESD